MQPSPAGTSSSPVTRVLQVPAREPETGAQSDAANPTPLQRAAVEHLAGNAQPARDRPALTPLIIPGGPNNIESVGPTQVANTDIDTPQPGNQQTAIQVGLQNRAAATLDAPVTIQDLFATIQAPTPIQHGQQQNNQMQGTPRSVLNSDLNFREPGDDDHTPPTV